MTDLIEVTTRWPEAATENPAYDYDLQPATPALRPERLVPHSADAEEALLGAVLINEEVLEDLAFLKPAHFFILKHRIVYEAMDRMHKRGDRVDDLTLVDELEIHKQLGEIGGPAFITRLITHCPTWVNASTYGHLIERAAKRREIIDSCTKIIGLAQDERIDLDMVIGKANEIYTAATSRPSKSKIVKYSELVKRVYAKAEAAFEAGGYVAEMPSNLTALDNLLSGGGFERGRLYCFAARPGMGKSIVLTYVARQLAKKRKKTDAIAQPGKKALFLTLEMSDEEVARRMMASGSQVDASKIKEARMNEEEWRDLTRHVADSDNYNLWVGQCAASNLVEVFQLIRQFVLMNGADAIFLDYLQLVQVASSGRNTNREQEVASISRGLKLLAGELNVAIVMASQLNRQVEARADKRPNLGDLRESGAIEQDCDAVIFVYRDAYYNPSTEYPYGAELIVAKMRDGITGTALTYMDLPTHTLGNYEPRNLNSYQ